MMHPIGWAFVVVQHLSPDFRSLMDELLARHTKLAKHRVEEGMRVEPNSLDLIPPKKELVLLHFQQETMNLRDVLLPLNRVANRPRRWCGDSVARFTDQAKRVSDLLA